MREDCKKKLRAFGRDEQLLTSREAIRFKDSIPSKTREAEGRNPSKVGKKNRAPMVSGIKWVSAEKESTAKEGRAASALPTMNRLREENKSPGARKLLHAALTSMIRKMKGDALSSGKGGEKTQNRRRRTGAQKGQMRWVK